MSQMKYLVLLALAASTGFGVAADAAEPVGSYGGLLISRLSSSDGGTSLEPKSISGLFGYTFNPGLAVEVRGGTGLGSEKVVLLSPSYGAVNIDVKVNSYFGAYVRASAPLSDSFNVYGLAGYADGKIQGSALGYTVSASESGFSWFVGAELKFGPENNQGIAAEWGRVLSSTDALSVVYRFRF